MGQPLSILVLEDSKDDAELLLREIRRGGYDPDYERVDSAAAMTEALERRPWDLVISDYVMPGFGGHEALALFQQKGLDVPFIVVSGHIGEDIAVAAMQAGADDYLMKDRLARLVPAIKRARQQADTRRAHRRANQALSDSEERFRQLAENIGAVFFMFERPNGGPGAISYVSPAYEKVWGCPCESLYWDARLWLNAIHPEDRQRVTDALPQMAGGDFSDEFRIVTPDQNTRWVQLRTFPVRNQEGKIYRLAALAEDITERKRAENELAANARQLQQTVQHLKLIEEELRDSNDELSQSRADLEKRVLARTADLSAANVELQSQINERKRLENELLEIAENERRRIGFDLHDDIGQKLMGVSMMLKALETNLEHKHLPEADATRKVQELVSQVIDHTHDLAHCVSSLDSEGDDLGLLLKKLVATVRTTFPIECRFRAPAELPALNPEATLQLYKIAQESVSNAIKHGKAKVISISLARQNGDLVFRIKNDGLPFPVDRQTTNRMGLRIMNYRARMIGGTLDIRPNGQAGTLVTCTLPYTNGHRIASISFGGQSPAAKSALA
jgi:two-component system, NarL family, sensor histidine kinase UhpB